MTVKERLKDIKDWFINRMWHRFSNWIHFEEWLEIFILFSRKIKCVFVKFFRFIKWLWNRFLAFIKWLWNGFIDIIRMFIFPATIIIIIIIMIIASVNYFKTNQQIKTNIESFLMTIDCVELATASKINDLKQEMKLLSANVFDSNAITFLVSFVLIFLGSILINIERKALDMTKSVEKSLNSLETEWNTLSLHSKLLALKSLIINYQNSLDNNNKDSIKFLNYRTNRMVEKIKREINEGKYTVITKVGKNIFSELIDEMITDFGMEEETINDLPPTSLQIIYKKYIDKTIKELDQLNTAILRLREV